MKSLKASAILLILLSGCASVQTTGEPFYPKGSKNSLANQLDRGLNTLTKQDIEQKIKGRPQIFIDSNKEVWTYKNSVSKSHLYVLAINSSRKNQILIEELVLTFDKQGRLTAYQIRNQADETREKIDYGYQISNGLVLGIISGVVMAVVNDSIQRLKEKN